LKDLSSLRIYRLSIEIGDIVWHIVEGWDNFSKWTIGKQLVDSSDGIAATMIEGYYRNSKGDQRKFFRYALSSSKETELWVYRAYKRGLIGEDDYSVLRDRLSNLIPQIINFIHKLKD